MTGRRRANRRAIRATPALAALLALASSSLAGDCRLALALALDVSSSVDAAEYRLQREGLAQALVDPEVVSLFLADLPVALYVFEWAGPQMQEALLPGWQHVEREADLIRIAQRLSSHPRTGTRDPIRTTAIGSALIHAGTALAAAAHCHAHTVDVSGDGRNNAGYEPRHVYATHPFVDVTVNALVVGAAGDGDELALWFRSNVLHGSGAFWLPANGYADFRRAMKAKLIRELELPRIGGWSSPHGTG